MNRLVVGLLIAPFALCVAWDCCMVPAIIVGFLIIDQFTPERSTSDGD